MLIASVLRTVERRFEQMSATVTIKTRKKITAPTKVLNINNKVSSLVSPPNPSQKDFGPSLPLAGVVDIDWDKVEVLLIVDVMLRALFSGHGISTASSSIATAVSEALVFVLASLGNFGVLQRLFTLAISSISGADVDFKMVTVERVFEKVLVNSLDFDFKAPSFVGEARFVVGLPNFVLEAVMIGGVILEVLGGFVVVVGAFGETVVIVVVVLVTVVIFLVVLVVVKVLVVVEVTVVVEAVVGAHSSHPPQANVHMHLVSQGLAAPGHQD